MAASDTATSFAAVLLWEAPAGDVRLCDGGVVKFDPGDGTVVFEGDNATFGTVAAFDTIESGSGDTTDGGTLVFAPPSDATLSDWWRTDLENTRLRLWVGKMAADQVTLTGEELLADWLVDTGKRERGEGGVDLLSIEFMTRLEKLFEVNQGNVCSDAFHDTIWPGERGFENARDQRGFFAWGTEGPRGSGGSFGTSGGGGGGPGSGSPGMEAR
jgi:hypothetical protein